MLFTDNLNVDILVVIFMKGSCGKGVPDPEVDGVGGLLEGYTCPWDVLFYVGE